ncbi:hypothetical protein ONS96_003733 [Cadophora gregata f. sp. sojae]|nr:hypothetical protein ONS96_003733 [Cadophora gregata f. sp. sojae]
MLKGLITPLVLPRRDNVLLSPPRPSSLLPPPSWSSSSRRVDRSYWVVPYLDRGVHGLYICSASRLSYPFAYMHAVRTLSHPNPTSSTSLSLLPPPPPRLPPSNPGELSIQYNCLLEQQKSSGLLPYFTLHQQNNTPYSSLPSHSVQSLCRGFFGQPSSQEEKVSHGPPRFAFDPPTSHPDISSLLQNTYKKKKGYHVQLHTSRIRVRSSSVHSQSMVYQLRDDT